jgi:putative acetyltransferase
MRTVLFNSYEFIFLFLPITFFGFFWLGRLPQKHYATFWLVLASFAFYGYWDYRYVPLLFASILFNYLVGQRIEQTHAKSWLIFGIVINVILLGYFKYMDFFLTTANDVVGTSFDLPHIVLPLGISFFTFTQTGYLIDAYRGEARNHSFVTYCEFVTIFPHLIAGPILNHKDMMPQFVAERTFRIDYHNIALGLTIFIMGLFKKVVIADRLSPWVADVFSHTDTITLLEAWIAALAYTFQLYFDFSGYSEMAIGLGLMFNLKFPVNFNSPYQARSIIDFWRRWHMTLGLWVREYLYIPLGGNRHGEWAKMRNLFVSMLIIGLWHGAGWTFVFWGAMHGVALMVNHQWRRLNIALPNVVNWGMTFLCVTVLWVFFRAENFHDAWNVIYAMAGGHGFALPAGGSIERLFGGFGIPFRQWSISTGSLSEILCVLSFLFIVLVKMKNPIEYAKNFRANKRWLLVAVLFAFLALCEMNSNTEFLYFQF